ncbi:hypothetical protein VST7929_02670 [Vibrio stylophorae]|uniref:Lipoprotein n=1 Tax=Vibrio stylophorae TaxID=659351 RepID=A0ABN8DXS8_9VIBR|nr:hypothetical protein [Vibrio stylophorae]CAH0534720.1 hypothetical protein VST7929_02670 [Vibrio stylophorae]
MRMMSLLACTLLLAGCAKSIDERADEYMDVSFELCGMKVQSYSHSDDGKIRILCENDSYFLVKDQDTLRYMQELNGAYCKGKGFAAFQERSNYFTFSCNGGANFNIPKN